MSEDARDVIVAGHICFDVIPKITSGDFLGAFLPGKLLNIGDAATSTGGPVSNTGIALHKLGVNTGFMGKVGNDFFGHGILDLLKQYGADKTMTVVEGEGTSYTLAIAPPGIDRIFLHNPGVNHTFGLADVNFDIVADAGLFHLGYPPLMRKMYSDDGRELVAIFRQAKQVGATTSLDMSLPDLAAESGKVDWAKILTTVLPYVDLFLPSLEETLFMLHGDRYDACKAAADGKDVLDFIPIDDVVELGDRVLELGAAVALLKCGHLGAYLRTAPQGRFAELGRAKPADEGNWAGRQLWEPSYHVAEVASATGSGDSAIAGFLAAFVKGESVESTLQYATAVGAHNVQALDAVSGIKSWRQTTEAIADWPKNDVPIAAAGWRFDERQTVWIGPADSVSGG